MKNGKMKSLNNVHGTVHIIETRMGSRNWRKLNSKIARYKKGNIDDLLK